jgi:hypothetical protein
VYVSIWNSENPVGQLAFGYAEGDADAMEFEEWRATRLDAFLEGLNSLMEEHDFVQIEVIHP